MPLVEQS